MAVEAKRGCGYRKIGGTYLVGGGIGVPCDRLPLALDVCLCCGQGIKQALGFTWVDVAKLVEVRSKNPLRFLPCVANNGQGRSAQEVR